MKAIALLLFIFLNLQAIETIGVVVKIKGSVYGVLDNQKREIKVQENIYKDEQIITQSNGWILIEQPQGNIIKISSNSDIVFDDSKIVTHNKGEIFFNINKNQITTAIAKNLPKFTIKTKTATMGIRGTNFIISLNDDKEQVMLRNGDLTVNANTGTFNYFKSQMLAEMQAFKDEFEAYKKQQAEEYKKYKESFAGYTPVAPTASVQMKPRRIISIDPLKKNLFEDNFNDETDNKFGDFDNFGNINNTQPTIQSDNSDKPNQSNDEIIEQKIPTQKSNDGFNDPDFFDEKVDKELNF